MNALRLAPWLLLSFVGGSLGALAFNVLAARALKPASYSLLTSIVFIFAIGGVIATGLSTANARSIAQHSQSSSPALVVARRRGFGRSDVAAGFAVGLAVACATLALSPLIGAVISAPLRYLIMAVLVVPLVVASGVGYGRLYGAGKYRTAQLTILLENAAKLLVGVAVAVFAFGTLGFEVAYAAGPAAVLVASLVITRNVHVPPLNAFSADVIRITLAMAILFAAMQIDIPLGRALFTPEEAGAYAAIAALAKALTGIAMLGGQVMVRRASSETAGEDRQATLRRATTYALISSVPLAALLALAGTWVVGALFGTEFVPSVGVVVAASLSAIPWAIAITVLQVRLAQDPSWRIMVILGVGLVVVINALVVGSWFGLAYFAVASGVGGLVIALMLFSRLAAPLATVHQGGEHDV